MKETLAWRDGGEDCTTGGDCVGIVLDDEVKGGVGLGEGYAQEAGGSAGLFFIVSLELAGRVL